MVDQDMKGQLENWLLEQQELIPGSHPRMDSLNLQEIDGDAGFRQYFRIDLGEGSLIAVNSPPDTENNRAFIEIDQVLSTQGVRVPKIVNYELARGFFLIEDLGDLLYLDRLNPENANTLYGQALSSLLKIQLSSRDSSVFPVYDRHKLLEEMNFFKAWFVPKLLGYSPAESENALLDRTFVAIADSALEQPQVVVHRDFHSRNIIINEDGQPGIIDFQDAVIGPITYDLVSLLRDCYISWPEKEVRTWALDYANMAVGAGVIDAVADDQFLQWFDLMGLQRHIKVLGIFSRLSLRDGKNRYLKDLPLVIDYFRDIAKRYPVTQDMAQWFDECLLPIIEVDTRLVKK